MQLQDFYDYKNQLMKDLLTNPEIVRLVDDKVRPDMSEILAYHNVFPYEYIPETAEDGRTYICFDVDILSAENKTFYLPALYIWVFAHKSKLRLPEGGVRTDALCAEIAKTIAGSREYGLGELLLYSVKRFAAMTDYPGKVLTFHLKDFNTQFDPNKYTPSNRKRG